MKRRDGEGGRVMKGDGGKGGSRERVRDQCTIHEFTPQMPGTPRDRNKQTKSIISSPCK